MIDRNSNMSHAELFIALSVGLCALKQQFSVCFTERTRNSTQRLESQHSVNILQLYFDNLRRKSLKGSEKLSGVELDLQFTSGDIETLICK